MRYSTAVAVQRLAVVRNALRTGALQLVSIDGTVLAYIPFRDPEIDVEAREVTWRLEFTLGRVTGQVSMARAVDPVGAVIIDELSVAPQGEPADVNLDADDEGRLMVYAGQTIEARAFTVRHP